MKSLESYQWFDHRVKCCHQVLVTRIASSLLAVWCCREIAVDVLPAPCREMVALSCCCCWGCPSEFRVVPGLWERWRWRGGGGSWSPVTDGGLGGVWGVLVLDELLLSLKLPPAHPALVAVPVEPQGGQQSLGHFYQDYFYSEKIK